jgi:hypothetical protein
MSRARDKANSTVSNFASTGIDDNADAIAITIDSSENVMIGTTDTVPSNNGASGDAGVAISPDGVFRAARSGNVSLDINRMDSDGEIAAFRKDGTTVGSIGSKVGDLTIGTDDTGFRFYDAGNAVLPYNPSTQASPANTIDLGDNGSSFKDLYLGGNLYIGGTGSANALDDYEEGTFTPTFTGASTAGSITYVVQDGRYVKIGKQVTLWIRFQYSAFSGSAGTIRVGGFPYASESGTHAHGLSSNWLSFGNPIPSGWPIFYISGGTSHANALISKDNTSWADWASSDFHLTSGTKYFNLNIFYKTA